MSGRDLTKYIPAVKPRLWGSSGKTIAGGMITFRGHTPDLFISEPNLRILADQLHDLADAYDSGEITPDQLDPPNFQERTA